MAGSATLDPEQLVDGLVPDIDDLRGLADEFGTRPFRLFQVARAWDSGQVGLGQPVDTLTELTPPPNVQPFLELGYKLQPCGIDEAGVVKITEVSLSYSLADLLGRQPDAQLPDGTENLFLLRENYGQGQPDRVFELNGSPASDRQRSIGWVLWLRKSRGR